MRTVGIVGAGALVETVHLPVLLNMAQVQVAWITDVQAKQAQNVAEAFGLKAVPLPSQFDDLPAADIALLGVPYGVRLPYYDVFKQRGMAVYAEKPLARTVDELETYCSWFPRQRFACGFQRRSWGPVQMLRRVIASGMFGRLRHMRFGLGRRGRVGASGHHSNFNVVGGGMLFEVGIHGVDALLFISNATAAQLERSNVVLDGPFDIHTAADLRLTTLQGDSVTFELCVSALEDTIETMIFRCESATLTCSLFGDGTIWVSPLDGGARYRLSPDPGGHFPLTPFQTFHEHWRQFVDGLDSDAANWTLAADCSLTVRVLESIYTAAGAPLPSRA